MHIMTKKDWNVETIHDSTTENKDIVKEDSKVNKINLVIIPEHLSNYFKRKDRTIVGIVDTMSKLDKKDFYFWDDFFKIYIPDLIFLNNYSANCLTTTPVIFERFVSGLYQNISTSTFFRYIEKEEDVREFLRPLFLLNSNEKYAEIEHINMSIKTNGYKNAQKFFDVEVNNLGVIVTLKSGFLNLCLKNSLGTILFFYERLFNCIVRNYGEAVISEDETLFNCRKVYNRFVSLSVNEK